MRKSMFYLLRVGLVWTVIVLLSFDTALACRWLHACRVRRVTSCYCVPVCVPVEVTCGTPVQKSPVQKSGEDMIEPAPEEPGPEVAPPAPPEVTPEAP